MSKFFINRPIVAMVISIVIIILGLVSLQNLPIAQYPEITPPMVELKGTYRGANAVNVEQSVATPLEQEINGVENMIYIQSINSNDGNMILRVSYEVGSDLDISTVLTQNRMSIAQPRLPEELKRTGLSIKKSLTFPLLMISVTSPNNTYDKDFLGNYTKINIYDQISRIKGVGQLNLFGSSDYSMRFWIKPDILANMGLTVTDVINAVKAQNVIAAGGQIGAPPAPVGTEFTYTVQLKDRLETAEEFGEIVVRTNEDGSQVKVKDVSRIELGTELYNMQSSMNNQPAALLAVFQIPGSNALEVAENIKNTMSELAERFPEDIDYNIPLDTTEAVTAGIDEIITTLFEALILVILVVFIFLQSFRATLIPMLTVPVSLLGTFIVFPLLGFSVNVLSLLGMVLAIGIVVDDAIVVVEAVMHNIEHGMNPKDATLKAMKEVSGPVIAIALILSAVFVPVAFISGITGRLYQQFAITIAISVLFSAFNALTLSPALSALLLRPAKEKKGLFNRFFKGFNNIFGKITNKYTGFTGILIRKMARSLIFIGIIVFLIVLVGRSIPGGFLPEEDQGYFLVHFQLPDAASMERTAEVTKKAEEIMSKYEEIKYISNITGYSFLISAARTNGAAFFVSLKPWEERKGEEKTAAGIIRSLNKEFAYKIPEAVVFASGPPAIPGLGTGSGFSMMLQDRGGNSPEYLHQKSREFIQAASKRPEIGGIFTTYGATTPQIFVDIDRERALKMGASLNEVYSTLGAYLGGTYINDFNRFGRLYRTYIQAEPEFRDKIEDMNFYFVKNTEGEMIPLSTLIKPRMIYGPEYTVRFNLFRSAEIIGAPAQGFSSGQALDALEEVAAEVLPADMGYEWNAMSYQEKTASGSTIVFIMALVMVFLILAAQYESWSLPFSVLLGTPFAVFGALGGLWLARLMSPSYVNNVFAQIALLMLVGLAAKNAILIVEYARMKYHEGMTLLDATLDAAKLRFRPILMTAFAFILGVTPLLTATGAGAEGRKVIGMAVFSGMLVATILGVFLIPVLFVLVEKLSGKKKQSITTEIPAHDNTEKHE